jgi:peroxin-2
MFAVPRLPRLPNSIAPTNLLAPITSFFSQPTRIDYDSIPLNRVATTKSSKRSRVAAHSGPLANLSLSTCPICYQRAMTAPVALTGSSTGSSLTLPPLHPQNLAGAGAGLSGLGLGQFGNTTDSEESRIFVPAQSDCWGECTWCYYCITGELLRFEQEFPRVISTELSEGKQEVISEQKAMEGERRKWDCLRCGGVVTRAWRVAA